MSPVCPLRVSYSAPPHHVLVVFGSSDGPKSASVAASRGRKLLEGTVGGILFRRWVIRQEEISPSTLSRPR